MQLCLHSEQLETLNTAASSWERVPFADSVLSFIFYVQYGEGQSKVLHTVTQIQASEWQEWLRTLTKWAEDGTVCQLWSGLCCLVVSPARASSIWLEGPSVLHCQTQTKMCAPKLLPVVWCWSRISIFSVNSLQLRDFHCSYSSICSSYSSRAFTQHS